MFGERKESSPQRRAPPRIADTTSSVSHWRLLLAGARSPIVQAFGVRPPRTPLLVFIPSSCGIASATSLCFTRQRRRSSFSPGRFLAEIARGSFTLVLVPTLPCAHWYRALRGRSPKRKHPASFPAGYRRSLRITLEAQTHRGTYEFLCCHPALPAKQ